MPIWQDEKNESQRGEVKKLKDRSQITSQANHMIQ